MERVVVILLLQLNLLRNSNLDRRTESSDSNTPKFGHQEIVLTRTNGLL